MLKVTNVYLIKLDAGWYGEPAGAKEGDIQITQNMDEATVFQTEKSARAFAERNLGSYTIVPKTREVLS